MRHELLAKYAKAGIYGAAASGDMATAEKILGEAGGVIAPEEKMKLEGGLYKIKVERNIEGKAAVSQLPSLASAEIEMILGTGVVNEKLPKMFSAAHAAGFISGQTVEQFNSGRANAIEARNWMDAPERTGKSLVTLLAEAEALRPGPADITDYDKKNALYENVKGALSKQYTALNGDPMTFVHGQSQKVLRQMITAGSLDENDPTAMFDAEVKIGRQLAAQYGVGISGASKVLREEQKAQYTHVLEAAATPQARIEALAGLNGIFGQHADLAFNELSVPHHERLALELYSSSDPGMKKYAQLAVSGGNYINTKAAEAELVKSEARQLVLDTDYGAMLAARLKSTGGLDVEASEQMKGLYSVAENVAMNITENGGAYSSDIQKMLDGLFNDREAIDEDYADIYLVKDENGELRDREAVLRGLYAVSRDKGDNYYWVNDGDDAFVLVTNDLDGGKIGQVQTANGIRSLRISRADAAYIGGDQNGMARAQEVLNRIPGEAPANDYAQYIEAARANSMNERALGQKRANEAAENQYQEFIRAINSSPAALSTSMNSAPAIVPLVENTASELNISPSLIMAIIKTESNFNPAATSKAGARGLMQLMPGTAADLGVNPDEPEENVKGGSRYIASMLARYGDNLDLALMAYNWGPGNVDKWMRRGGAIPLETRNYVASVKNNFRNYQRG